ncbi:DNA topoisomerase (ATP-hydrolyzing) [Thermocrinis sp.]|uniref:DNA gyrase/topoisomerase IV subunit A n=1 Tax=Thermocrinis sp. TaxID=2024383 RepID=UPI002FDD5537
MEIIDIPIEEEVKQSYIDYAMSVIVGRAIPDVRDGLKPVQRRILYAMYDMGLLPDKNFVKSARIVGTVLGYFHPHGDQAVYEALVRMAQDFVMNYPLIVGQGNFGSIDGDPPAAMRYTEAKLSKYALLMLEDIDKDTVDFVPNFDGSALEPQVLPSKFPNLLCNGTSGIAVGLATSIPPHNLKEVAKALILVAQNPDVETEQIMEYLKGPDFPTGGIVENYQELIEFYKRGKGQVRIRAKAHIEKVSGGREQIVITEIPYQVNKSELIKRMAELVKEGRLKEISDIRDESDKEGLRIVVELKREAKGSEVLEKLYRYTQLRRNFPINFVVLIDGEPRQVGIKVLLQEFIRHRLEVIYRRSKYYLKKAEERLHIVNGLMIALSNLDQVIQDIRTSKDGVEAKEKLMKNYSLTEVQANAVLELRLQRLTSLERKKLEEEEKELREKIAYYRKLVESEEERVKLFIEETSKLAESFPTIRRTFVEGVGQESKTGSITVVIFSDGRVLPLENIKSGEVINVLEVPFDDGLFMVSNRGKVYWIAGVQALQGSRVSFKEPEERVIGAFVRSQAMDRLLLATSKGYIKKIPLVDFEYKAQGISVIKLTDDQGEVVRLIQSPEEGEVLFFTKEGKVLRFPILEVSPTTVGSKGVAGIKVERDDEVVGLRVIRDEDFLLLITDKGRIKKIEASRIPTKSRASKGVGVLVLIKEELVDVIPVKKEEEIEIMLVTAEGSVFYDRLKEEEIPTGKFTRRWGIEGDRLVKVVIKKRL